MKAKRRVLAAGALAVLAFPAAWTAGPARGDTSLSGTLDGQMESYAMRVEYDLPLPAGTGTVAHVSGEARRSDAGENAKGLAGAPTEMDAVVSGKYVDPQGTGTPQRNLPQSECFYPGSLVNTHFYYPTDTQAETAGTPPIGYAAAQCSAGPTVQLRAHAQGSDVPGGPAAGAAPLVTTGAVASEALSRPVNNTLAATTASSASAVSILGGVIKIGSVIASGDSSTSGHPGGGATRADVKISDITAGGQTFSLASSSDNGKERFELTAAGQSVPVDSSAAKTVLDGVNAALQPQGCTLTPLTTPATYPQGYLFSRPEPALGLKADGSLAASDRGGLLIVCSMPRAATDNLGGFSPERVQILLGFAYTGVAATSGVGGFNLGDLGGAGLAGAGGGPLAASSAPVGGAGGFGGAGLGSGDGGGSALTAGGGAPTAARPTAGGASGGRNGTAALSSRNAVAVVHFSMRPGLRWLLGLCGLAGWLWLTHMGASRFLAATVACEDRP